MVLALASTGSFKTESFSWRLAQQSLPTGDLLNHRNMVTTSVCGLCGDEDSWLHSLMQCNMSRCVCALAKEEMVQHMLCTEESDAKSWLFIMHDSMSGDEFTTMVVTLWVI